MPDTLRGRQIVLAGGAGGIGSAASEMLAAEGAGLVIGYHTHGDRAARFVWLGTVVEADLTQADDRRGLLDAAPELYGVVVFTGDPARVSDPAADPVLGRRRRAGGRARAGAVRG